MKKSWMVAMVIVGACASEPDEDESSSSTGASASEESSTGTSASTGVESESGSESGSMEIPLDCDDPQPLMQGDGVTPTGWVRCSDGFTHRVEAVACIPQIEGVCEDGGACTTAEDCTDAPLGACVYENDIGCGCVYGCETDADCDSGQICMCAGDPSGSPRCLPANCATSADCGDGLCGVSSSALCGSNSRVACLDASSECRRTVCEGDVECACYASTDFEYQCHDECYSGCG